MSNKKIITPLLAAAMAAAMLAPMGVSALAKSTESVTPQDASAPGAYECNVTADVPSGWTVTIPKSITLDGVKKSATYKVVCNGDFPANKKVTVVPDDTFMMSSGNKTDVAATVEQDKIEWLYEDAGTEGSGTITAEGLTAGSWNGSFDFNIGFGDKHEHNYNIPVYKTVHVDEVGHWEEQQVMIEPERNEEITEYVQMCNGCGKTFGPTEYGSPTAALEALDDHQWDSPDINCQGYHSEETTYIIHHDAKYETKQVWIVDAEAHDETVIDYYKCECGERQ